MSEHRLTFANDDFKLDVTMTAGEVDPWSRVVAAVMDVLREPSAVLRIDGPLTKDAAESLRLDWLRRRGTA